MGKGIRRNSHAVWNHMAPPPRHGQKHHQSAIIWDNMFQRVDMPCMKTMAYWSVSSSTTASMIWGICTHLTSWWHTCISLHSKPDHYFMIMELYNMIEKISLDHIWMDFERPFLGVKWLCFDAHVIVICVNGSINTISALVQILFCRWWGDKPLPEMLTAYFTEAYMRHSS